jgi:hypothetical protein
VVGFRQVNDPAVKLMEAMETALAVMVGLVVIFFSDYFLKFHVATSLLKTIVGSFWSVKHINPSCSR